jgi:hypothetical protein
LYDQAWATCKEGARILECGFHRALDEEHFIFQLGWRDLEEKVITYFMDIEHAGASNRVLGDDFGIFARSVSV